VVVDLDVVQDFEIDRFAGLGVMARQVPTEPEAHWRAVMQHEGRWLRGGS